jgi:uncharacterized membrane protein YdjX (TVP38/TMEM64 family)
METSLSHRPRQPLLALSIVVGMVVAGAVAMRLPDLGGTAGSGAFDLTIEDVRAVAMAWAPWHAVAALALMILHSFVPVPAEVIAAGNGLIFGPVWGTVITWSGAMLGAVLSFGLSRLLGRPLLRHLAAERYWQAAEQWRGRPGFLVLVRLLPVISFNLINYAAGLSGIRWWTFLWTTGIGILPITTLSVLFGDRLRDASPTVWIGLAFVLALLLAVGRYLRKVALPPNSVIPAKAASSVTSTAAQLLDPPCAKGDGKGATPGPGPLYRRARCE